MIINKELEIYMARKSADFEVIYHLPQNEEERQLLAIKLGELHLKIIKEVMNDKMIDITKKNKIISDIEKKILKK